MSEITCKRCHHSWTPRVPNPVKCPNPKCGYPTGLRIPATIREAINLPPPLPTMDTSLRIDFTPRLYLPSHRFATLNDEEWKKLTEEAIEDYKDWLKEMRGAHKERQRQHIVELAGRIMQRGRQARYMWRTDSIPTLIKKVQLILRRNQVETKKDYEVDRLKSLESWDAEAELEKWLKETEISRETVASSMYKKEKQIADLKEDEQIVKLAIPIFQEIVAVYDVRIDELKDAEVRTVDFVKRVKQLTADNLKRAEEISRFVQPLLRSGVELYEPKMVEKAIRNIARLLLPFDEAEKEYDELVSKIHSYNIDPPLPQFPPTKLSTLSQFKPNLMQRIWREIKNE